MGRKLFSELYASDVGALSMRPQGIADMSTKADLQNKYKEKIPCDRLKSDASEAP